jgi:hypothetical protein
MESQRIIDCTCGARVRIPVLQKPASLRCPACKSKLDVVAIAPDDFVEPIEIGGVREPVELRSDGATCPICQTAIASSETVNRCPACDVVHHDECWNEIGGCGTYGCEQAPKVDKEVVPVTTRAWGDTKTCPACGETIRAMAIRCRFCRTDFQTIDPMGRDDLIQMKVRKAQMRDLKRVTLALFTFSLLGITSPITGLISSAYLMPKQDQLRKCGAMYLVLAWMIFGLSALFSSLIAVFLLFEWA